MRIKLLTIYSIFTTAFIAHLLSPGGEQLSQREDLPSATSTNEIASSRGALGIGSVQIAAAAIKQNSSNTAAEPVESAKSVSEKVTEDQEVEKRVNEIAKHVPLSTSQRKVVAEVLKKDRQESQHKLEAKTNQTSDFTEVQIVKILAERRQQFIENVDRQVDEIAQHMTLSPEKRKSLVDMYSKEEELFLNDLSPDEWEAERKKFPSEEDIIGVEQWKMVKEKQEASGNESSSRTNGKEILYLTKTLELSPEQEKKLQESYDLPERYKEIEIVNLLASLNESAEVKKTIETHMREDYESKVEEYVSSQGGKEKLPENLLLTQDGETSVNDYEVAEFLRQQSLRKVLSDQAFNAYLQALAENTGP